MEQYDSTIKEQLERGVIEAGDKDPERVQLLCAVTRLLRNYALFTMLQPGPSLNECLHKGPKFNQLILDLLLRFRSYPIADVEKAFLMIAVNDRCLAVHLDRRYNQGVTSVPICQSCVWRFLKPDQVHLEGYLESNENTVRRLLQSTYVDDIVTGAETQLYVQAKDMFRHGGFNLRKFLTNSRELQQRIDRAEGIQPTKSMPGRDVCQGYARMFTH